MSGILTMVVQSHLTLLPDVPMVGWDVAMTNKGVVLLEVNLSCNFFRG
jgi:glutathione synthase/RimK-type ligase-like ATP-grasp enzyme